MMNARLLSGPRAVLRDLVAKRLWPIAVLLVVALIAVPIVLSRSSSDAPAPAAATPVTPAAEPGSGERITVADAAVLGRSRPGAVHDPFFDPPAPKSTQTTTTTTTTNPSSSSSSTPSGSGATTVPPTTTPPATTTTTPPATPPVAPTTTPGAGREQDRTLHRTRVRWGADETADVHGLSRLQPLGDPANPALLYLGTNSSGTHAAFLLGPNALSKGDGDCADAGCRVIALSAGDTQVVAVAGDDGQVRTFTLVVDEIVPRVAATIKDAIAQRARVNAHGRDVLREMIKDPKTAASIGLFAYDRATGAVVTVSAP